MKTHAVAPTPPVAPSSGLLSPAALAQVAESTMEHKAHTPPAKTAVLAVLAGFWIALGFAFFITTQTGAESLPWGLSRIVGGVAFSTGLFIVVTTGADLFTSTTMTLVARAAGLLTWPEVLRHWLLVWSCNFVGALGAAGLCFLGGVHHNAKGAWGQALVAAAAGKVHHGPVEAFFLGILCNVCVCVAVWVSWAGKSVADKALAVVGPVALFVATGMEHSVANMFLVPYAIAVRYFGGVVDASAFAGLDVVPFLVGNLIPVTLGNIVGGGVIVGLGNWWVHRSK